MSMDFSQVDKPFHEWAKENDLHVFEEYKDSEVRSVNIVLPNEKKWQLWLEPNPDNMNCTIRCWDYGKDNLEISVPVVELKKHLQATLNMISTAMGPRDVNA